MRTIAAFPEIILLLASGGKKQQTATQNHTAVNPWDHHIDTFGLVR
jgi:hypothetical protein